MGQKVNSNILRLSLKKNEWKSKYIEKLTEESSIFVYNDLEIRKYLDRFFQLHGLILHDCKINYSNNRLDISLSYFVTTKALKLISPTKVTRKSTTIHPENGLNFTEMLLESISEFTKRKVNVSVVFYELNRGFSINIRKNQTSSLKKIKTQLRQFKRAQFFRETLNILFVAIKKGESSKLLAKFIAIQLSTTKRHNFFLIFLKQSLILLLQSNFSAVSGVKIVIKGRFNGAPRARSQTLLIGSVPQQFFDAKISYSEATAYTPNGTFGIKCWISEN
jgi:ribosomal protein S3